MNLAYAPPGGIAAAVWDTDNDNIVMFGCEVHMFSMDCSPDYFDVGYVMAYNPWPYAVPGGVMMSLEVVVSSKGVMDSGTYNVLSVCGPLTFAAGSAI